MSYIRTKEYIEKLRKSNLEYFKNTDKTILQQRWNNISEAKKQRLTQEEIQKLEPYLKLGYVKDKRLLLKKAGVNRSYRLLDRYIKENPE